jgi:hypothetical protein
MSDTKGTPRSRSRRGGRSITLHQHQRIPLNADERRIQADMDANAGEDSLD